MSKAAEVGSIDFDIMRSLFFIPAVRSVIIDKYEMQIYIAYHLHHILGHSIIQQ